MADENNSVTLEFLGRQMERMFSELAGLRAGQEEQAPTLVKLIDAVSMIAQVQEQHSVLLGKLHESQKIVVGRLNVMDARMGHLEKHAGFVDV